MSAPDELTISIVDDSGQAIDMVVKVKPGLPKLNMTPDYATSEELWETTQALERARARREAGEGKPGAIRPLYMYEPGRKRSGD